MSDESAKCLGCGKRIGVIEVVRGLPVLVIEGIRVRSLHGQCKVCGESFHWQLSDRMLEMLVEDVLKGRDSG